MSDFYNYASRLRHNMAKYRKKPVVIEAFIFGVDNMPDWFCDARSKGDVIDNRDPFDLATHNDYGRSRGGPDYAIIKTLEGNHKADFGDYVIQGIKGELYPCKPDIFELTYEVVP